MNVIIYYILKLSAGNLGPIEVLVMEEYSRHEISHENMVFKIWTYKSVLHVFVLIQILDD